MSSPSLETQTHTRTHTAQDGVTVCPFFGSTNIYIKSVPSFFQNTASEKGVFLFVCFFTKRTVNCKQPLERVCQNFNHSSPAVDVNFHNHFIGDIVLASSLVLSFAERARMRGPRETLSRQYRKAIKSMICTSCRLTWQTGRSFLACPLALLMICTSCRLTW